MHGTEQGPELGPNCLAVFAGSRSLTVDAQTTRSSITTEVEPDELPHEDHPAGPDNDPTGDPRRTAGRTRIADRCPDGMRRDRGRKGPSPGPFLNLDVFAGGEPGPGQARPVDRALSRRPGMAR